MGRAGGLKKGPQGAAAVKKPREEKEPNGAGEIKSGKAGLVWGARATRQVQDVTKRRESRAAQGAEGWQGHVSARDAPHLQVQLNLLGAKY